MQFIPFGYNHGDDDEIWEEPVRMFGIFAKFVILLAFLWGLGALVLAVKDPIPRWGMVEDK